MASILTSSFSLPEIATAIVGFFFFCGLVGYGLKKNGLLTFGKPTERRNCGTCPEHDGLTGQVTSLNTKVDSLDEKIDTVVTGISSIEGFLQGRDGYHKP